MQSVALGYTSVPTESLGILIMLFKAWLSVRYLVSILHSWGFLGWATTWGNGRIFYAAGLLPVLRQFGREFFRFAEKNLNFLKYFQVQDFSE